MTQRVLTRAAACQQQPPAAVTGMSRSAPSPTSRNRWFGHTVTPAERERVRGAAVALLSGWNSPARAKNTPGSPITDATRYVVRLLDWLDGFPGDSYQDRWLASEANAAPQTWSSVMGQSHAHRSGSRGALHALLLLGVIRPDTEWLLGVTMVRFWRDWTAQHDTATWDRFFEVCQQEGAGERVAWHCAHALVRVCIINNVAPADITTKQFLEFRRRVHARNNRTAHHLATCWHLAKLAGLFADGPDSLEALTLPGPKSPAQLVDSYGPVEPGIRVLLINYLTELAATCDYGTMRNNARALVRVFWGDLQKHNPGLKTLHLTKEQANAWKQRTRLNADGSPRMAAFTEFGLVRSFYLDIAAWAHEDPVTWGPWAAPCPISARDITRQSANTRRASERMQARTRVLAPHLPALLDYTRRRANHSGQLLERTKATPVGGTFELREVTYTRQPMSYDHITGIRITAAGSRALIDPVTRERTHFWTWAAIQTLHHSGIRIEELTELTHLSIRQFQKPDGQLLPLLQIAPSKNDRERIIPASPELTSVLARIVARLLTDRGAVPLCVRRDDRELAHSAPLPYLFQLREAGRSRVLNGSTIRSWMQEATTEMGLTDVDGAPIVFTPHDFRRLFITDMVNEGFPIHLVAELVGHQNIQTTRGYTAVYQKDVFLAYDEYIARRRELRPNQEYRPGTQEEWQQFHEHFLRRKVSLGDCHRPFGSDCSHEHACIRCTFLQVDPGQAPRLDEIEANLHARVEEARSNSWLGDVDQLNITLTHLHAKQDQVDRLLQSIPTPLITAVRP